MLKHKILKAMIASTILLTPLTTIAVAPEKLQKRRTNREVAGGQSTQLSSQILATAQKHLGKPYLYGSNTGQTGHFDCSSFVKYVYSKHGITLPRVSRDQANIGRRVDRSQLKPGDLIFFATGNGRQISHVGIYQGSGRFIHASLKGVRFDNLDTNSYYKKRYVAARRVL